MKITNQNLKSIPDSPGCYLFYDNLGYVIYVGKSKNLANRVKSYFTKAALEDERTKELVPRICDIKIEVADSELDAILNEYRLIKKYKPWHNSQLKADKKRPYLKISNETPYASLSISEDAPEDDCCYYDFFANSEDVKETLDLICKVWRLPKCGTRSFKKVTSPCIYHTIDGCLAPCSGKTDASDYMSALEDLKLFFAGGESEIAAQLSQKMLDASKELNFEKAAYYKDLISRLEVLKKKSRKLRHLPEKGDVLILIRPHGEKSFSAFYARNGAVIKRVDINVDTADTDYTSPDNQVLNFVTSVDDSADEDLNCPWLAGCLTEVIADKVFLPISVNSQPSIRIKKIVKEFIKN